jgi:hypothetical protein
LLVVAEVATPSSKPLPLRLLGLALLVLQRLSIWLWLVGVGVVDRLVAVAVLEDLELEQDWLLPLGLIIRLLLEAGAQEAQPLALRTVAQVKILYLVQ